MDIRELESKEGDVRAFFESFLQDDIETILERVKNYEFVRPIAIGMGSFCSRKFKENFTKELFFWLILMSLKLDEGDICLRLNADSILSLIKENVLPQDIEDETLIKLAKKTVESFIENTLKTPFNEENLLISCDKDKKTPLIAYKFEDKEQARLYLRSFYCYERSLADFIKSKSKDDSLTEEKKRAYKKSLDLLFESADNDKVNYQKIAAALSCTSPFTVICGGPGTGKTTTVLKILLLLLANTPENNTRIMLAAPTGKAAGRMVESIVNQLKSDELDKVALKLFNQDKELMTQRLKQIPREASTVHSLLKVRPHNEIPTYNIEHKLPCEILVIDEISMISLSMFSKLINAIGENTKVIMLGDKDQLCSVEPGSVLSDICSVLSHEKALSDDKLAMLSDLTGYTKDKISTKKDGMNVVSDNVSLLIDSWRFSADSKLGKLASLVNNSTDKSEAEIKAAFDTFASVNQNENKLFVDEKGTEVTLNYIDDNKKKRTALNTISSKIAKAMVDFYSPNTMYLGYLKEKNFVVNEQMSKTVFSLLDKYRILCAKRQGVLGVEEINEKVNNSIRQIYRKDKNFKEFADDDFYPGAAIMVTRNDRFLNLENGDIGFVAFQSEEDKENHRAKVFFPPKQGDKPRIVSPERISEYESGFAITIHKSQGSEYQNVCMVLSEKYNPILTKELVYTGLTRAKAEKVNEKTQGGIVSIITDEKILVEAIKSKVNRESGLALMLKEN